MAWQVEYESTLGELGDAELTKVGESNALLLLLELLIMTAHLSSAKLPRYLSALELHASLASKLELQVRALISPKPNRHPP